MKKIYFILVLLIALMAVSCESTDEANIRLKQENAELTAKNEQLQNANSTLNGSIKTKRQQISKLNEQIGIKNVQASGKKVRFYVTVEIKQSTFTLDVFEHLKNDINAIDVTFETSDDFYYSVKKGQEISSNFKKGSFLIDGDISDLNITVKNKYTK